MFLVYFVLANLIRYLFVLQSIKCLSNTMQTGYVYILTNESFREDWVKIGKSSRPVDIRSKELDNTAVPLPFSIYATMQTSKYHEVEALVHKFIDRLTDLRIRQNREFFNVSPEIALDIFRDIARTVDDAKITIYRDNKPVDDTKSDKLTKSANDHQHRRKPFKFSMVGICVGETITFTPTGLEVKVADDKKIEFGGRLYTLSAFTGTFLPADHQNSSGAYQGPKYFSYNGENLWDLRKKSEKKVCQQAQPSETEKF